MSASELGATTLSLAATVAAGRVLLSLFPAGLPGRHGWKDLPITLATSWLLGAIAFELEARALALAGAHAAAWMLFAPWVPIAIGRWLALPGAMVPRHAPPAESATRATRLARAAAAAVVLLGAWSDRDALFAGTGAGAGQELAGATRILDMLALLVVCDYALDCARRAPLGRGLVVLGLACALTLRAFGSGGGSDARIALCFASGAAFSVPWLRRADRRAALVAAVAFASAPLFAPRGLPLAISGLVWLCVCTPGTARKGVATASAVAFALCAAFANVGGVLLARTELASGAIGADRSPRAPLAESQALAVQYAVISLACAWAIARALRERAAVRRAPKSPVPPELDRDATDPDGPFLFDVLLAACVLLAVYGVWTRTASVIEPAPLLLAPAALWFGATFVRADRSVATA